MFPSFSSSTTTNSLRFHVQVQLSKPVRNNGRRRNKEFELTSSSEIYSAAEPPVNIANAHHKPCRTAPQTMLKRTTKHEPTEPKPSYGTANSA
jgi:hypothetical protein